MSSEKQGSLLGSILLLSGCCIGAGMLGLPVISANAGFFPSLLMFVCSWLFMATTGLLLLEVNLWFHEKVSIITMAGKTLGKSGQAASWFLFLFLFYSLMVAYSAASGALISEFTASLIHLNLPQWLGSLTFISAFGILIYLGTEAVDRFNRLLIFGLLMTYLLLVTVGLPRISWKLLMHTHWPAALLAAPAMVVSFGYHNLIPTLTDYLNRDTHKLRIAVLVGSALPLLVYLLWQMLILGLVPYEVFRGSIDSGVMATQVLASVVGASWIGLLADYFAFFSIITSFLAVALSLVDFLADGLSIRKTALGKVTLCLMTLIPPFVFALLFPNIFLKALNYAGAFGAVILFGIIPSLMVWSGRYVEKIEGEKLVPGGKAVLLLIITFSLLVFLVELAEEMHWIKVVVL
ncbi:MAG: aromatic amino acid transport family protein [Chlamydiales bacterium]